MSLSRVELICDVYAQLCNLYWVMAAISTENTIFNPLFYNVFIFVTLFQFFSRVVCNLLSSNIC